MNAFVHGLRTDLQKHVFLNRPRSFAEAENLARLMYVASKSSNDEMSEMKQIMTGILEIVKKQSSKPESSPTINAIPTSFNSPTQSLPQNII